MIDILLHPLIVKYFACHKHDTCSENLSPECIALSILRSMQESIRKGERYLCLNINPLEIDGPIERTRMESDSDFEFHPFMLRLPDKFQPGVKG